MMTPEQAAWQAKGVATRKARRSMANHVSAIPSTPHSWNKKPKSTPGIQGWPQQMDNTDSGMEGLS